MCHSLVVITLVTSLRRKYYCVIIRPHVDAVSSFSPFGKDAAGPDGPEAVGSEGEAGRGGGGGFPLRVCKYNTWMATRSVVLD